jgi:hypothetical protein
MAQPTKTPIVTYHSTVAAAVPSNANLQAGELAVNIADMKLYTENSSGTVTLLASADAAAGNFTTVDTTNLEVTNIKAKDGTAAIVLTDATGAVTVSSPFATTGNTTLGNASADTVTVTGTITSNLIFTDNTYDIGASGATRPRNMFLAGNATIGGNIDLTGALDLTNLEVTNIKAKDGTASASIANATGVMTIASSVLTTTDINGGTIDGTTQASGTINGPIAAGGTWTAAATWTLPALTLGGTVTSNGQTFSGTIANLGSVTTVDINGGTVDGTAIGSTTPAAGAFTTLSASSGINSTTIGSTTPAAGAFTTLSATGAATFAAGTAPLPSITTTGDPNTGIYFPAADTIGFAEGGAEAMRINSSGIVLVGTTTASGTNLLQVNSDSLINTLTVGKGAGSVATNTAVGFTALGSNTDGFSNTALGYAALTANTGGDYNTAVGSNALDSNTSGIGNSAFGFNALQTTTTASYNSAFGYSALSKNTSGTGNTGLGFQALEDNTTGGSNTAVGNVALYNTTTGSYNTAVGDNALATNITGSYNTAVGYTALFESTGNNNTAVGNQALSANTSASNNAAFGYQALASNLTGSANTSVGSSTLASNTASNNTAVGYAVLNANTTGANNTAVGYLSITQNISGTNNAALGYLALYNNNASNNTAVGSAALYANTTTSNNSAFGSQALNANTSSNNTAVGYAAGQINTAGFNNTFIGYNAQGASVTSNNAITLGDSSIGTLRCQVTTITALSDRRDKKDIVDIPAGLNLIEKLRPVSFVWNMRDGGKVGIPEFGFIAQELQEAQSAAGVTVPNLVYEENPEKLEASAGTLIPVLVKAIQELKSELDLVKSELASLKGV